MLMKLEIVHLHDDIAFSLGKLHLLFEGAAKGIQRVSSWGDLSVPGVLVKSVNKMPGPVYNCTWPPQPAPRAQQERKNMNAYLF